MWEQTILMIEMNLLNVQILWMIFMRTFMITTQTKTERF